MRLAHLRIRNFRSCKDVTLDIGGMHALADANNAGKSTVLRALDFLFSPSAKSLNEESFWNKDTSLEIRVEGVFSFLIRDPLLHVLADGSQPESSNGSS
ncbi:MAG: AAA family ATPase [bacterium]